MCIMTDKKCICIGVSKKSTRAKSDHNYTISVRPINCNTLFNVSRILVKLTYGFYPKKL